MEAGNEQVSRRRDWAAEPDEFANALTHGVGFVLSVVGAIVLTDRVRQAGDGWRLAGCLIYAFSLVMLYAMSTLSHLCSTPRWKRFFRMLDQGFIYLLIVGTYTPFSLAFLRTRTWWLFLAFLWAVASFGFVSKILLAHRVDRVSVWIYVVLGWLPLLSTASLVGRVPGTGLWWMLLGGLFYTTGIFFLTYDYRARHFHALWHLFVIAGSASHFFVILRFVASRG